MKQCSICKANPQLQGGLVYQEDKPDILEMVCGLHLTEDGKNLKEGEAAGNWLVFNSWGYAGSTGPQFSGPSSHALAIFDEVQNRVKDNSDPNWGWKIVVGVGPVSLEASTFPKNGGYRPTSRPSPAPQPGTPVELSNEEISQALPWKHKKDGNTYPAELSTPWAYTFVKARDGTQTPLQGALETAIKAAEKGRLKIDDYTYTLAGTDKNLFNRNKGKQK